MRVIVFSGYNAVAGIAGRPRWADQLSTVQLTLIEAHAATSGDADWPWWLSLGAVVAIWPVGRPSQHQLPSSSPLRPVRLSSMESFDCF